MVKNDRKQVIKTQKLKNDMDFEATKKGSNLTFYK